MYPKTPFNLYVFLSCKNNAMNSCVCVFVRREISAVKLLGQTLCPFKLQYFKITFPKVHANLHSYWWYMRLSVVPGTHQHWIVYLCLTDFLRTLCILRKWIFFVSPWCYQFFSQRGIWSLLLHLEFLKLILKIAFLFIFFNWREIHII